MTTYVHVLDPLHENMNAEDIAMVQALYSRDPQSVAAHLKKVSETGSGKFMDRYYTGYGHDSIGDCGVAHVFVEGVSLLCAVALEHHPLFNGQESSTRYIDFSQAGLVTPEDTPEMHRAIKDIQDRQMQLYQDVVAHVEELLIEEHLSKTALDKDHASYPHDLEVARKATRARAFDAARGFLPTGVKTNVTITMGLRPLRDHLRVLSQMPMHEIRSVAAMIWDRLSDEYPHSFPARPTDPGPDPANPGPDYMSPRQFAETAFGAKDPAWHKHLGESFYHFGSLVPYDKVKLSHISHFPSVIDDLAGYNDGEILIPLQQRQRGGPVPTYVSRLANIQMQYPLDFGSYRDIHRHRRCDHDLCWVDVQSSAHRWYVDQISAELEDQHISLVAEAQDLYHELGLNSLQAQYLCVLGQQVQGEMRMDIGEAVYIAELRSSKTVHPTLRPIAQQLGEYVEQHFKIPVHIDRDPDPGVVLRRGTQDITEVK